MKRAHFLTTGMVLAVLVACGMSEDERRTAQLVERYTPVLVDAGLGWGLGRLGGLVVKVHPDSDGGRFPTPGHPSGKPDLADDATFACYSFPSERICWVNDYDDPIVGHCLAHVARSDFLTDAGYCIDDLPRLGSTDHEYFAATKLDSKCAEAAP